jgi:hypothetical protein
MKVEPPEKKVTIELARELNLPPVNQIEFVVKDLEKALHSYTPLFGEFTVLDAPDMEWDYRSRPEKGSLRIAFGYSQIWYKRFGEGLAASYLEREGEPLILEFFENK